MVINKRRIPENMLIIIYILYTIMPIVSRMISTYLTTYFYMLIVVLLVVIILFSDKIKSINQYAYLLFPFMIWQVVEGFGVNGNILMQGYGIVLALVPVMLGIYIFRNRKKTIKMLCLIVFCAFLITMYTTIIGLLQYPSAARWLATVGSAQDTLFVFYNWKNIGGYELVYSVVLLYPLVIFAFKQKRINLLVAIILSMSIFLLLILSEYTIAILLFVISTVLFFLKNNLKSSGVICLVIMAVITMVLFEEKVSDFLVWLGNVIGSEDVSVRLEVLAGGTQELETFDDKRFLYYMRSINTFFEHPLLGTVFNGRGGVGGHSFILDTLGKTGVLGAILLVIMYKRLWKMFYKPYKRMCGYGYVVWFFAQAILLAFINPGMHLGVLALFGPLIIHTIYEDKMQLEISAQTKE